MASTKKPTADYAALSAELETILTKLQAEDTPIDEALKQYERGLAVIKQLEAYLQTAENKISELQASFNRAGA
jgi:exodeoxyribonuclease VII small subunit